MAAPLSNLSKTSNAPIFTNSVFDIDKQIVSYISDPTVLVALSGVNRAGYRYLTNGEFFKDLFAKQHPHLAKLNRPFRILCEYHPSNCWKVACSALFFKDGFKLKASFCADVLDTLRSQKAQLEQKLKEICGSGFADPNSLIDKAWKAYEKSKLDKPIETQKIIDSYSAYDKLEVQRAAWEGELKKINQNLKLSPIIFIEKHAIRLNAEFKLEGLQEKALIFFSTIEECLSLIDICLSQHPAPSDCLTRLRGLVNSLEYGDKTRIWGNLYFECAAGANEDQWSENHFADFLSELREIIEQVKDDRKKEHLDACKQLFSLTS